MGDYEEMMNSSIGIILTPFFEWLKNSMIDYAFSILKLHIA